MFSSTRCTSKPDNLDLPSLMRSKQHTELAKELFSDKECWENFGIVADIVVCDPELSRLSTALIFA
jgi:hypothetical protein